MVKQPFEASFAELEANPEPYIDAIFSGLISEFWVMPKGNGFVDYSTFDAGYEKLKQATGSFATIDSNRILLAVRECPIAFVVLRSMLGFSPPEWAYITTQRSEIPVNQGYARSLDRRFRLSPLKPIVKSSDQLQALIRVACQLINEGASSVDADRIHRLDKCDTKEGKSSVQSVASIGVPYSMLLYERFLGRPFAGHRDSVSELVGDPLESGIESVLAAAGVTFQKTKRAKSVPGFKQAPDFIIPNEFNPKVIIEAKFTEDDGTARDKIGRVGELVRYSREASPSGQPKYQIIACIAGRGFAVRRNDIKKLLLDTKGKVFTTKTLDRLVDSSDLKSFCAREAVTSSEPPTTE
jgi:hypothetical protein